MELKSKVHGSLEYNKENEIIFKKGILGFEKYRKFAIIDLKDSYPFKILHSIEDMELSIIIIDPFIVDKKYEIKLNNKNIEQLEINKAEDVLLYTTVTLNSNIGRITTNLSAPIVINIEKNIGEQIILDNSKYKIKHPIYKES